MSRSPDALRILDCTQVVDARHVRADKGERPLATAGCDQQPRVCQQLVIVEANQPPPRINRDDSATEHQVDISALVILAGRDERVLKRLLTAKEFFG